MAQVRLNLDELNRLEKVLQGEKIAPLMTGNADFPDATDLVTTLITKTTALKTKNLAQETAVQAAKDATAAAATAEAEYDTAVTALAKYAESASEGNRDKLLGGGFDLRGEGGPVTVGQVTGLAATAGDDAGEVDLSWDAEPGAKSYEAQSSPDPNAPNSWTHLGVAPKSKATFAGLPSGAVCYFRVRAVGPNNTGGWSDIAMKRIP